jgi:hemerythrin
MFVWEDKYSVGISIIDEQHKNLFGIINKTIYAKEHGDNTEELTQVLEEMTQYALEHFEAEEAYMIMFNYPEYEYHNEEHYGFIAKTAAYFDRVVNGDYHISNELLGYLKQWLVNHIQSTDRKYIDCFKRNGLK